MQCTLPQQTWRPIYPNWYHPGLFRRICSTPTSSRCSGSSNGVHTIRIFYLSKCPPSVFHLSATRFIQATTILNWNEWRDDSPASSRESAVKSLACWWCQTICRTQSCTIFSTFFPFASLIPFNFINWCEQRRKSRSPLLLLTRKTLRDCRRTFSGGLKSGKTMSEMDSEFHTKYLCYAIFSIIIPNRRELNCKQEKETPELL